MIYKLAILGSCVSRDVFNTKLNPGYKQVIRGGPEILHQHQFSFLSLMSEPCVLNKESEIYSKANEFSKTHISTEFDKSFLTKIKEEKPDYLIIDLYGDIYEGAIDLGNGNFITNNKKFNKMFTVEESSILHVEKDFNEYFVTWKEKTQLFFEYLKNNSANTQVLIVDFRFGDKADNGFNLTELRKKRGLKTINVDEVNDKMNIMIEHLVQSYSIKKIDLKKTNYLLTTNYLFGGGTFYVHFEKNFSKDFFNEFLTLIINDEVENKKSLLYNSNLMKENVSSLINDKVNLEKRIKKYKNETLKNILKRKLINLKVISNFNKG